VADTLVRVAGEMDAAATVVGTSGIGGSRELLLGGTARHVIRRARCPVVLRRSAEKGHR
jgi:nucleotide-binding universal stress UspA family protein